MKKIIFLLPLLVAGTLLCSAHTINYVLDEPQSNTIFLDYIQLGYKHILPLGLDHILFIICVFFLNTNLIHIFKQATLFTVAHSITLAMVACNIIIVPSQIVEPIIALSIAVLAIENIFFTNGNKRYRYLLIFSFGLVHGMGFAGALAELNLPTTKFTTALIGFNVGVELGQLSIILVLLLAIKILLENKIWYRNRVLIPTNIAIGVVALFWFVERIITPS